MAKPDETANLLDTIASNCNEGRPKDKNSQANSIERKGTSFGRERNISLSLSKRISR